MLLSWRLEVPEEEGEELRQELEAMVRRQGWTVVAAEKQVLLRIPGAVAVVLTMEAEVEVGVSCKKSCLPQQRSWSAEVGLVGDEDEGEGEGEEGAKMSHCW